MKRSTYISEGGTHDDGFVTVLLVVVEDLLHGLDTRVFVALVGLAGGFLVPVEDLRPKDQEHASQECMEVGGYSHVQQRVR